MQLRFMIPTRNAVRMILYASARLHAAARLTLAGAAMTALATTLLSALGVLPWLILSAGFSKGVRPEAGMVAQIGVTGLLCVLVMIAPSNDRIRALEQNHRDFRIMDTDVANAYHAAHAADRTSVFALASEFDRVREDLDLLRTHPSLRLLEVDMLRVAQPPAASERAIIQADHSGWEAGERSIASDRPSEDDVEQAHPNHEAEHASRQLSA